MDKFEYKTLFTKASGFNGGKVDENMFQYELNELGQEGWELVSTVAPAQGFGDTRNLISIFKRRRK